MVRTPSLDQRIRPVDALPGQNIPFRSALAKASNGVTNLHLSRASICVVYILFVYKRHTAMGKDGSMGDRSGVPGMLSTFRKG